MPPSSTTTLKLDAHTKARLQKLGGARRRSPHWLMKDAIAQYLAREEQREQLRLDALAAWRRYQETGLHVSGDEVERWLRGRAAGQRFPTPRPHR